VRLGGWHACVAGGCCEFWVYLVLWIGREVERRKDGEICIVWTVLGGFEFWAQLDSEDLLM
jgi:hypothetical protein